MKARSAKAKGTRLEKAVVALFESMGWKARKQPGSGIYQSFPHDVHAEHPTRGSFIVECKSWKHGWRTGDNAMGQAEILVIKRDYGEPCVYMSWAVFAQITGEGKPDIEPDTPPEKRKGRTLQSPGFCKDVRRKMDGTTEKRE